MDKQMIIKGCEKWVNNHKGENYLLTYSSVVELLTLLKEQEAEIRQLRLALDDKKYVYEEKIKNVWICKQKENY